MRYSLPLALLTALTASAHAAPVTLGVQAHPAAAGVRPVPLTVTVPFEELTPALNLSARFDVTLPVGGGGLVPVPSTTLLLSPSQPLNLAGVGLTPYAGAGLGGLAYQNGGLDLTWLARAGVTLNLPGQPIGVTFEGQATRAGLGWSTGLTFTLPEATR
ncbi:hypothetical protein [Deinococcus apachensis]|uniref:hypothetical protein n=1 Tax=Deinococcus apachensis TaxID=309886 RepID=UPI0003637AA5|nr:hypothetical protein [Deinococcus apachensis]